MSDDRGRRSSLALLPRRSAVPARPLEPDLHHPVVAVVPVKRLAEAKGRLQTRLAPAERLRLVVELLRSVLDTLAASDAVTERLVVSPDEAALAVARAAGASVLRQHDDGLNEALTAAQAHVPPTATLLLVPGDLPLLRSSEIEAALALAGDEPSIVIAPDRQERGTNLLVVRPAQALPFQFGPDSFARHREAAQSRHLAVRIFRSPGTAFDLDTPADLDELARGDWPATATLEWLSGSSPTLTGGRA